MRVFLLCLFFFFLIISDKLQEFGIPIPAGSRHVLIFIFVSFLYIISFNRKINMSYLLAMVVLIAIALTSFVVNEVNLISFSISIFISFLFSYCFLLASGSDYTRLEIENLSIFIIASIIICGLPGIFNYLLNGVEIRYTPGLFREAGAFATAHVIACAIALSLNIKNNKKNFLYIAMFLSLVIIMAGLKKSMGSIILIWLIWSIFKKIRFYKFFVSAGFVAIILSPLYLQNLIINIQDNVDYFNNVGSDGHIRIAMYLGSFNILSNNILLGSGLGTFGSLGSLVEGFEWPGRIIYGFSPIYYEYGLIGLAGVNETSINNGTGTTYLDTYWPHIVAELGILGLIPFLFLWLYPLYAGLKIFFINDSQDSFLNASAYILISICLVISWEGLFLILPEVPAFIFLHAIYTGAVLSATQTGKKEL